MDKEVNKKHPKIDAESLIDYRMIPAKISYFLTHALFGAYMPYCNVFLTSVGLTPSQAGLISGLRTIVSFFCGPMWGALVDHTGRRKLIYVLLCFGTISLLFPLPWIARYVSGGSTTFEHENNSVGKYNNESNRNSTILKDATTEDKLRKNLFFAMLASLFASAVFDMPLMGYQDSIVMDVVNSNKRKATFGVQRVFGSFGFGIANFLAGLAADNYNQSSLSSYTAIFFVFLPAGLFMMPFGIILHKQANHCERTSTERNNGVLKLVFKTCSKCSTLLFLLTVFVMGLGNAINYGFTFLLMEDYMEVSKSIMGLSIVVSCGSEILVFPAASRIIRFLGGTIPCIIIGVFVCFIRFLLISFVENPWLVLPIQSLNCLSFALPWAASLEHTQILSPSKIHTTMFSILTGIHFPLGTLIGNMVGGPLYEKHGGRTFFRASSLVFACWGALLIFYFYVVKNFCFKTKSDGKDVYTEEFREKELIFKEEEHDKALIM